MPYTLRKQGGKVAIVKKTTGEVVGHSDSKKMGMAAIRARMAHEGPGKSEKEDSYYKRAQEEAKMTKEEKDKERGKSFLKAMERREMGLGD